MCNKISDILVVEAYGVIQSENSVLEFYKNIDLNNKIMKIIHAINFMVIQRYTSELRKEKKR